MAGRLANLRGEVLDVISELAWGYKPQGFIGTGLMPVAVIPKMQAKIPKHGLEAFRRYKTKRGLGADSNRMPTDKRDWSTIETEEHDAEFPIDYLEEKEANFNLQKHAAFRAKAAVELELECEIADMAQDLSNYEGDFKTTLIGTNKWSDQENSNPEVNVQTAKDAIRSAIGMEPNTAVMGYDTYKDLRYHPALIERIKYTMKGVITVELLKELLDIENILIGKGMYVTDTGETFTNLWNDNFILAYVPPGRANEENSVYEPAWAYTVRRQDNPFVFQHQPNPKLTLVNYTDNFAPAIVGPGAAYIINDTH